MFCSSCGRGVVANAVPSHWAQTPREHMSHITPIESDLVKQYNFVGISRYFGWPVLYLPSQSSGGH